MHVSTKKTFLRCDSFLSWGREGGTFRYSSFLEREECVVPIQTGSPQKEPQRTSQLFLEGL